MFLFPFVLDDIDVTGNGDSEHDLCRDWFTWRQLRSIRLDQVLGPSRLVTELLFANPSCHILNLSLDTHALQRLLDVQVLKRLSLTSLYLSFWCNKQAHQTDDETKAILSETLVTQLQSSIATLEKITLDSCTLFTDLDIKFRIRGFFCSVLETGLVLFRP